MQERFVNCSWVTSSSTTAFCTGEVAIDVGWEVQQCRLMSSQDEVPIASNIRAHLDRHLARARSKYSTKVGNGTVSSPETAASRINNSTRKSSNSLLKSCRKPLEL